MPALLDRLRLGHDGVTVEGTPRRLAVVVRELAGRQSNSAEHVRGPPAKVAYDARGAPTPALLGFCKKNGVTVEDCFADADAKGVEYVWAEVKQAGRPAAEVRAPVADAEGAAAAARQQWQRWQQLRPRQQGISVCAAACGSCPCVAGPCHCPFPCLH